MTILICAICGYLLGSIPFGLVLTKMVGIDLRKVGPGTIGATNVLRTGRKDLAILTVLLDASKAGFAAWIAHRLVPDTNIVFLDIFTKLNIVAGLAAGTAAILGHNFPIWLKFKGGKGVASTFGFVLVTSPYVALLQLLTWLIFAFTFKYSSLAAIAAAILTPLYAYFYAGSVEAIFYTGVAILAIIMHHTNIKRLINGTETKIKLKKS